MPRKAIAEKYKAFADMVLSGESATEAYKKISPKVNDNVAGTMGSRWLNRVEIASYITQRRDAVSKKVDVSQERIVKEYARIAFADPRKAFTDSGELKELKDIDDDTAAVIAGIEVDEVWDGRGEKRQQTGFTKKVKFWNKVSALDSLSEMQGIFKRGTVNVFNVINIKELTVDERREVRQRAEAVLTGAG
jgi:phage terminase small subunit